METNIKTILLAVQQRLADQVPELAYIDKNWGQLDYEAPPVKWPCALLDIDEITHIETDGVGRGCVIHTTSGKTYNGSTSLGEYEGRLAGQAFYRIHKTCLVQLRYVESIFPWTGSGFALLTGDALTIYDKYYQMLKVG